MSYRRRFRWFRRMTLGLAFASVLAAGSASVASAKIDGGTGSSRYVTAGGWSGEVDAESGIPIGAGIPEGDEQFIDGGVDVIPYLSHGVLTQAEADAAAAQAIHDPFLSDVFVRPGESLGGPDGDAVAFKNAIDRQSAAAATQIHDPFLTDVFVRQGESLGGPDGDSIAFANALKSQEPTVIPYLSHGLTKADADIVAAEAIRDEHPAAAPQGDESQLTVIPYLSHGLTKADADILAAEAIHDPNAGSTPQGLTVEELRFANAIVAAADSLHDPVTEEQALVNNPSLSLPTLHEALKSVATSEQFVPGVTDFPTTAVPSDVTPETQVVSSDSGPSVDWNEALMVGFGALVLVLGLGLAIGFLRRPRLAGL